MENDIKMDAWRRLAIELFPERCKGYWGFNRSHMSLYHIFFELKDDLDQLIRTNDEDEIKKIFQLVNWCFDQRHENRDIWNAAATAFLEHLADTTERAVLIPKWVQPAVFEFMQDEFEKRRERDGAGKFQKLLHEYNAVHNTQYS